jgi:hypothetical protein
MFPDPALLEARIGDHALIEAERRRTVEESSASLKVSVLSEVVGPGLRGNQGAIANI